MDKVRVPRTQTFLVKVLDHTSSALRQLYRANLEPGSGRTVVLRWKVPSDTWLVADEIRNTVQTSLRNLLSNYFENLDVHILNSTDQF